MALTELVFVVFVLYLLYKLVFSFILPVSKAAASVRSQMRNMQGNETMHQSTQSSFSASPKNKPNNSASTDSEYIDFEEIK